MDLEAVDQSLLENPWPHALSELQRQSICNTKISATNDADQLADSFAFAVCSHFGFSIGLYSRHDDWIVGNWPVPDSEISATDQRTESFVVMGNHYSNNKVFIFALTGI